MSGSVPTCTSTNGIAHAHHTDVTVGDESEPPPAETSASASGPSCVAAGAGADTDVDTDAGSIPPKQSSASKRRQRKKNLVQNQRLHSATTAPHAHPHLHPHLHTRGSSHVKSAVAHHDHENVEVDVTGIVNGSPRSTSSASSAASSPLSQSSSLSLSSIVSSPVTTPPYTSQPHAWTTSSMQTSPTTIATSTTKTTPSLLHLHATSQSQQQTQQQQFQQQQQQQQQQAYRFHPHQHMIPMAMPFFHPSFLHPSQHLLLQGASTTLPMSHPHAHPHPHPHAIPMSMSMPSVWFPPQQSSQVQVRVPSTPPPSQLAFSRSWTSLPPAMTSPTTATSATSAAAAAAAYSPRHHLNNQMTYGMPSPVHNGFTSAGTATPETPTQSQVSSQSQTQASPIPQPLFSTPTKSAPTQTSHETPPSITKRTPSSSPPPSTHKLTPQPYDYYCILDFEATCAENDLYYQHEIIEFPVVFVNSRTLQIDYEFHSFVKPSLHPELTPFCTRLTGITQSDVSSAPCLSSVLTSFENFCLAHNFYFPGQRSLQKSHRHTYASTLQGTGAATPPTSTPFNASTVSNRAPHAKSCCFVTDGPWDFISFLEPECSLKQLPCPPIYHHFIDLRQMFSSFYACKRTGIKQMLQRIGLQFQGREHSGLADSRNIARIAIHLLQQGCLLTTNLSIYP